MKDNESRERALMHVNVMSDNIVKHVIHQMQSDFELRMVEDVRCLSNFQVKNYACGSQGTYADKSCTQQLCNNQMKIMSSKRVMKMSTRVYQITHVTCW